MKKIGLVILVAVVIVIALFSSGMFASKTNNATPTPTASETKTGNTYILVHGAWQDETAWNAVRPLLEAKGNKVVTVNLPGHGIDQTPVSDISLKSYVDAVVTKVNQEQEPVVLVGHSMAGLVISEVAEAIPTKIKYLVYVAAYLPKNGDDITTLSKPDTTSKIDPNMELSADYSLASIKKDGIVSVFCADCSQEAKDNLVKNFKAEPTKPLREKAVLSADKFGSVAKYYISTTQDHAVGTPLQQAMIAANGAVKKVVTIESSHLPFIAKPDEFVTKLLSIEE